MGIWIQVFHITLLRHWGWNSAVTVPPTPPHTTSSLTLGAIHPFWLKTTKVINLVSIFMFSNIGINVEYISFGLWTPTSPLLYTHFVLGYSQFWCWKPSELSSQSQRVFSPVLLKNVHLYKYLYIWWGGVGGQYISVARCGLGQETIPKPVTTESEWSSETNLHLL